MEPLNLCYVLASTGRDDYSAMAAVSAHCVRRLHANAHIHLLCDEATEPALREHAAPVLALVDRVHRIETGMPTPVLRSRFVKTSMRRHIEGDFIFIDVDTMPVRP